MVGLFGLLVTAVPLLFSASQTEPGDSFRITVSSANVREQPSTSGAVIVTLPRDTLLPLVGNAGAWVKVETTDRAGVTRVGFILGSLGRREAAAKPTASPSADLPLDRPADSTPATPTSSQTPASTPVDPQVQGREPIQTRSTIQNPTRPLSSGLAAGLSMSTIDLSSNSPGASYRTGVGVFLGAYVVVPFSPAISLQGEIAYVQRFSHLDTTRGTTTTTTEDYKLTYLEFPILGRFGFSTSSGRSLYVIVGPGLNFRLSGHVKDGNRSTDIKSQLSGFDASFIAGAGGILNRQWALEARYDAGLRDIVDAPSISRPTANNRSITGLVRYRITQ